MRFYIFMKHWSSIWMLASIGATLGAIARKDWPFAIFCVMACAINHFCYNVWNKRIKDSKHEDLH